MEYALAKELADAGFPQKYPWICGCDGPISCLDHMVIRDPRIPSLEELVEACGKDLGNLNQGSGEGWYCADRSETVSFHGSTPTEAVAHLWLALNK